MKQSDKPKLDESFDRLKVTAYQPGSSTAPKKTKPKPSRSWKRKVLYVLLALVALSIIAVMTVIAWNIRNFVPVRDNVFDGQSVMAVARPTPLQKDQANRTNILFIGDGSDREFHGGADLTDTILLVSLDHEGSQDYMLSIPRDLYVPVPGFRSAKINEAYPFGERNDVTSPQYRSGGAGVLEQIFTEDFGLDIHYVVNVNFSAVEDIVDSLGGIEVVIDSSDERGIFDPNFLPEEGGPLRLSNGEQQIDGQTALKLTRARDSTGRGYGLPLSDFDRTENQQKVVKGIAEKLDWRIILNPAVNASIFNAVAEHVDMDVSLNELIPLYRQLVGLDVDQVNTYTLRDIDGQNLLSSYRTPEGLSALIPAAGINDFSEIQRAIRQIHQ